MPEAKKGAYEVKTKKERAAALKEKEEKEAAEKRARENARKKQEQNARYIKETPHEKRFAVPEAMKEGYEEKARKEKEAALREKRDKEAAEERRLDKQADDHSAHLSESSALELS